MKKIENEENGLIRSQNSLYLKLKRINQLFKNHLTSLILLFLFAVGIVILLAYLMATGQITTDLSQRYGLFGTIVSIFITTVLFILIIQIGIQAFFYGSFVIRGNRSLKQSKGNDETRATLHNGIVPFITNFYAFFNRYSKEKTSLIKLVSTFLFLNFISGFFVIFLFTRLMELENADPLIGISIIILFLAMLVFWLINLMTSIKIRSEVAKWEKLFPKLDDWAQNLEQLSSENSIFFKEEETS
jgi:hypothetical protein